MKRLGNFEMETTVGGDRLSDCLLTGLGAIGIGISIAMTPVTGGSSLFVAGTLAGGTIAGIGVGASAAGCLNL